ncbi:N-6 DNA methylase [Labilibaculum sp. A4]|uniref:type I restriction-modification system subunit M n=1 Tax=Labilibaculum euxinus TaxID=2686357 RepID=UPI000F6223D3|nr:type I restriction-modification system subunit M [Labilibaculum euxinus]MDQ1769365.1 N-6 DNA methylase [Labilibaculum euxinus]MWN74891.1 N-6 DNA methylase [Labilibaculum euxinus]
MQLQQKINRITDILRRDDGISGAMHYTEQISWILFLKFLDDFEEEKQDEAQLNGTEYKRVIAEEYQWKKWACPKDSEGEFDIKNAKTGKDLTSFVYSNLFPYLKSFKENILDRKSLKYKIGNIFEFLDNKVASGHTLREVLDIIDSLNFQSQTELFELSQVYENLLQGMGNDGGNSGEFYTPRPVVKAMINCLDIQPGESIYDGAAGSCGFLIEAFEHIKEKYNGKLSTEQWRFLHEDTFYGNEKTPLAYIMGMMNMILHGIESPNLYKQNTLTANIRDIQEKDRYNIILANPPFGGKEKPQIQQNFPIASNATELLFLQHFMKSLKQEGKAAIVVPEGVLFQTGNAFAKVKQELLENFNLHTILSLPAGVFLPYSGVKTNIIFFDRKGSTSEIWYYECVPPQKLTKNKPVQNEHLAEFVELFTKRSETQNSWLVKADTLVGNSYDISAKNPNNNTKVIHLAPTDIIDNIKQNDAKITLLLNEVESILKEGYDE